MMNTSAEKMDFLPLTVTVSEEERQVILLAFASLSRARPGWDGLMNRIAEKLQGRAMLAGFRSTEQDLWPGALPPQSSSTTT